MRLKLLRKRFQKSLQNGQKNLKSFGIKTEKGFEKYLLQRLGRLESVSRFVTGWILLMVLLIAGVFIQNITLSNYYQTVQAVPGGIYKEGMLSTFTNASPVYATTEADQIVSRLVFSGLMKYDQNGEIAGDLAEDYTLDTHNTTYTFKLKPGLRWHDGKPLTSEDVVFTFQTIQNPDVQSPLRSSFQGVTATAIDARTVAIKLPTPLTSFIYNLNIGIIPKHILAGIPAVELRSADFNTIKPVGAGPFKMSAVEVTGEGSDDVKQQVALTAFEEYNSGPPKLQEIVVNTFASKEKLAEAFRSREINAASGFTEIPKELENDKNLQDHSYLLRAANMVFFKVSEGALADQKLRSALVQATDTESIIRNLGYQTHPVVEPFLSGQSTFDPKLAQASFSLDAAKASLDAAGWLPGKNGVRAKSGVPLKFELTVQDNVENRKVANQLREQWRKVGADVKVVLLSAEDFQVSLSAHNYQAVLHSIPIGVDPDVFVYWESTQADIRSAYRLNLSEYKDKATDAALLAGRSREDPSLRAAKYRPFLQSWKRDAPAIGLYQPRLLYITNRPVEGLPKGSIASPVERTANVYNWQIRQAKVTNP